MSSIAGLLLWRKGWWLASWLGLASLGGWLGRSTYDLFHPEPLDVPQASYDETDRLLARYPGPVSNQGSSIFGGWDPTPGIY